MAESLGRRILIVDDDPDVMHTFARMLRLSGYQVLTAPDAESAWREMAAMPPDAVLLDLRMPRVDGLGFLRELRAREPERRTPVAIVTGDYFIDENMTGELANLDALVCFKPLWLEDLMQIARRLVNS